MLESREFQSVVDRLNNLEKAIESIERNCCNKNSIEAAAREALLLEQLIEKIDSIIVRQDKHEKFFYLLTGGIVAFEYLGVGEKLKAFIS